MRRCLVCSSDEVFLWLGGSIGTLYHWKNCHYVGAVVIEAEPQQVFPDQFASFWALLEEGSFWSETGIANHMLLQT